MKILVGIDHHGVYKSALNLAARLKFQDVEWVLAHVVDVSSFAGGYDSIPSEVLGVDWADQAEEAGRETLEAAREDAEALGLRADTALLRGRAGAELADYAEKSGVDLIVVRSERKGRFGSLFFGSVCRSLTIASKVSLMISKGELQSTGPLRAVWATDHSEYASKALDKLIEMSPKRIASIRVISALHLEGPDADHELPIAKQLRIVAEAKLQQEIEKLEGAGYDVTGEILDLPVNEAIAKEMDGADLLLMGAQGHGFFYRAVIGSTSLHQVVAEPYPVLLLRP